VFIANVILSLVRRRAVDENPWGATTLEWAPAHLTQDETPLTVVRGPCEYSADGETFHPQWLETPPPEAQPE
jgi:heme/copper-type cytochrome/quinol oxidase subunit 1